MTHGTRIVITPYDASWPALFEAEREALLSLLAPLDVSIEHVGSTAVPGLAAKPIVDLMLGCANIERLGAFIPALEGEGWEYVRAHEDRFPERRFLAKPRSRPRQFHLHAVEWETGFWERHIAFRDYLRRHPDTASSYQRLKIALAARLGDDREAYTEAKAPFIAEVLRRARSEDRSRVRPRRPTSGCS